MAEVAFENLPGGHKKHFDDPEFSLNWPAPHSSHAAAVVLIVKRPGAHNEQ
jgi:hypothetical protein